MLPVLPRQILELLRKEEAVCDCKGNAFQIKLCQRDLLCAQEKQKTTAQQKMRPFIIFIKVVMPTLPDVTRSRRFSELSNPAQFRFLFRREAKAFTGFLNRFAVRPRIKPALDEIRQCGGILFG